MNEPFKKIAIRKSFEIVLPQVAEFIYFGSKNHNIDDLASGDLYTRLRREFFKHFNSYDVIQRKNIDKIYSHEGTILHIGFLEQNYAPAEERRIVTYMNEVINELTLNEDNNYYKKLKDEVEINTIIESIKNFDI